MRLSSLCLGYKITRKNICINQLVTPLACSYISLSITIPWIVSISVTQPRNWSFLTSIPFGIQQRVLCSSISEVIHSTPNFTDFVQNSSQSVVPENIYLKNTWFVPYLEEDTRETQRHKPIIVPENKINTLPMFPSEPHVNGFPTREKAWDSDLHKCTVSEWVCNTSKLGKVGFTQNPSDTPSGIAPRKGDKLSSECKTI